MIRSCSKILWNLSPVYFFLMQYIVIFSRFSWTYGNESNWDLKRVSDTQRTNHKTPVIARGVVRGSGRQTRPAALWQHVTKSDVISFTSLPISVKQNSKSGNCNSRLKKRLLSNLFDFPSNLGICLLVSN